MSRFPKLAFARRGMESHYALDRLGQLLYAAAPKSLRIYCSDAEMLMLAARRLYWLETPLLLDSAELAEQVSQLPHSQAVAARETVADVGLILFERQQYPTIPKHRYLVILADNRLSYKSLLYRKQVYDNVWQLKAWFKQGYQLEQQVGLFGARFLWHWTISQIMESRNSALHFKHQQSALDHIFDNSALADLAYLQILAGKSL